MDLNPIPNPDAEAVSEPQISGGPVPASQFARAGEAYREEKLVAFSSWPTPEQSPSGYFKAPLTAEAVEFYRENGYLVLEDALTPDEIARINQEALRICRGDYGEFNGILPLNPDDQEEEILSRYLCLHYPDRCSPFIDSVLAHPSQLEVLTKIIGPNVKNMHSMLFIKASGKPGQAWHQDEYFTPTRDRSLCGGWMALDDATVENGCLWVLPGSHRSGIIWPSHAHNDRRFDCSTEARFPYSDSDAVPVEVKAGSIVFFNGYLLHRSLPNTSQRGYRRVLVNHYMSAESFLPWGGVIDNRDIRMVAGIDPYAYKGIDRKHITEVRPSGEGGCFTPESVESNRMGGPSMGGPSMGGPSMGGPSMGGPSMGGPSMGGKDENMP